MSAEGDDTVLTADAKVAESWALGPHLNSYYEAYGTLPDDGLGSLSASTVRDALLPLGLPREDLRQIWELSDMDRDGRLDRDEYAVALHLVTLALEGTPVPAALPPAMVPPSKRPY